MLGVQIVQIQPTSDLMLDLLTGLLALVTAVMAGATVFLGATTLRSAREAARTSSAAQAEADATLALVLETRRNRELEMQPVVVRVTAASVVIEPGRTVPGVRLQNVGRGAAVGARGVQQIGGDVFWTGSALHARQRGNSADESVSPVDVPPLILSGSCGAASVEPSLVSLGEICVFCFDQLGNGLKLCILGGQPRRCGTLATRYRIGRTHSETPSTGGLGWRERRPRERDRFGVPLFTWEETLTWAFRSDASARHPALRQ